MDNRSEMFGGLNPQVWGDSSSSQSGITTTDPELLRTLFTNKGYGGKNAMIWADTQQSYSSTNGQVVAALFRVENSTDSDITWSPSYYYSAYSGWGEYASVTVDGQTVATHSSTGSTTTPITIPANTTSTVIFVSTTDHSAGGYPVASRTNQLGFFNDSLELPSGLSFVDDLDTLETVPYRWTVFDSYNQSLGWIMDNRSEMFGGLNPQVWGDSSSSQSGITTTDPELLRTLFPNKGYGGKNAMIWADTQQSYSSTNGQVVAALFRVENSTDSDITWSPSYYYSAYSGWGEYASVTVDGQTVATHSSTGSTTTPITIPANTTSTVIFVSTTDHSAGGYPVASRTNQLGFFNDSLELPSGLSFVDDLAGIPALMEVTSPNGFLFDIDPRSHGAGQLVQGTSNAFDGLNRLQVDGADFSPTVGFPAVWDDGRTLITQTHTLSNLEVSRRVTVPDTGSENFARTVDTFYNPTQSDVTTTVKVVGNLGSDTATTVFGSFDGDTDVEPSDQWIGTDDADGSGTPAIIHYLHGPDGLQPTSVNVIDDNVEWTYELTIPAGHTFSLAHFTILADTQAEAVTAAGNLVSSIGFGGEAAAFLSSQQQGMLANFQFGPPVVTATTPSLTDGTIPAGSTSLDVFFDQAVVGSDNAANFELRNQGPDGLLGNADDEIIVLNAGAHVMDGQSPETAGFSARQILNDGYSVGDGIYWLDPDGPGGTEPFQAYADMTRDGGGWTLGLKTWYQAGHYRDPNAVGDVSDGLTLKSNPYKLSDDSIRDIIGSSNNFDVMADQAGYNHYFSTGNYEYAVLRNYTGEWTWEQAVPASSTPTRLQSYRISDGALAWDGELQFGVGGAGINGYVLLSGGQIFNMGTQSRPDWHHLYMADTNSDSYMYLSNGAQHSSNYNLNHRFWFRETVTELPSAVIEPLTAELTFPALEEGVYRLTVKDTITNFGGTSLDGDIDSTAGGDYVRDFVVISEGDTPVPYRWAAFDSYNQSQGWIMDNRSEMFGGLNPQVWGDSSSSQSGITTTDPELLRTLFTNKGYGGKNAMIWADTQQSYSSTNGQVVAALFRVENSTDSDITWSPSYYYSAYSGWGEYASVTVDGQTVATHSSTGSTTTPITIPANTTSTVIFVSTTDHASGASRTNQLGFFNDSLELPNGLSFVDDLDTLETVPYRWTVFDS